MNTGQQDTSFGVHLYQFSSACLTLHRSQQMQQGAAMVGCDHEPDLGLSCDACLLRSAHPTASARPPFQIATRLQGWSFASQIITYHSACAPKPARYTQPSLILDVDMLFNLVHRHLLKSSLQDARSVRSAEFQITSLQCRLLEASQQPNSSQ